MAVLPRPPIALRHLRKPHWLLVAVGLPLPILVCLASILPWPWPVRVSGEVVARSVTFRLGQELALEPGLPLDAEKSIRLDGFDSGSGLDQGGVARGQAVLRGHGPAELAALHLAQGASVTIAMSGPLRRSVLQLLARGGASLGLEVNGQSVGGARNAPAIPDMTFVQVASLGRSAVPLLLQAVLGGAAAAPGDPPVWAGQFAITALRVSGLRFGQESRAQADQPFISSITNGQLSIIGVDRTLPLKAAVPLQLPGFQGTLLQLSLQPDGIHLLFGGEADRIRLGPPGFPEDVTPTIFGIAFHAEEVQFILVALAWMIGVLLPETYKWLESHHKSPSA